MANPFKVFRKNQKVMIALLTILVMFGFVFLPIILERMGGQSQTNPVVVKTAKFGDLRESDLQNLRERHQKVLGVLGELMAKGEVQAAVAAGSLSAEDAPKVLGSYAMWGRQQMENIFGRATEEEVANRWLLARRAEQMGMIISDKTINGFLKAVTHNAVKAGDFQDAFRSAGMSVSQFFALMRDELMARQLQTMFQISLLATTPGQRWDYFNRVKRLATIEAAAVVVADYVEQIEEPTEEELKKFFAENKNKRPNPTGPEPGFRRPQKVALEYFKADMEKFAAPEMVTEEEIQQRYEKNKDYYDKDEKQTETSQETKNETEESKNESKELNEDAKNEAKQTEKVELSEDLKNRIRRDVTQEKILKIFEGLREQMDQYREKWEPYNAEAIRRRVEADQGKEPLGPPPPGPDFEKLAEQNGLGAGRTRLVSKWEAQGAEIGASLVEGRIPVWHYAWQSLAKFRPERSQDLQGNLYLFWKTEDVKEHVPKFDDQDVREEVLGKWKMIRARELAMGQAKSLADEVRKADEKSLKQAFADRPEFRVVLPPPFSWMTFGSVALSGPRDARLSDVEDVDMAGQEFMRTVFRLQPGQVGAAFNAPQTVAYVIRLAKFNPSYKVLWSQFEVDDFSKYASVSMDDQRQIFQAWLKEIQTSAGFDWVAGRRPDQMMESEPPAEE